MSKLDIVSLIENDTNTHLKNNYKNNLLTKIQNTFEEQEQQLFVASFYCYLKYNSSKDFVIDFKDVWKWCGFTRKDHAKTLLERYFTEGVDYIVEKVAGENEKAAAIAAAAFEDSTEEKVPEKNKGGAGKNKENIFLTVDTFKYFCMKAGTKKADDIHKYYVKLEKLLHETLLEQTDELQIQLEQKEQESKEQQKLLEHKEEQYKIALTYEQNKAKYLAEQHKKLNNKHQSILKRRTIYHLKEGNCVYLIKMDDREKNFKIGITGNITDRIGHYRTGSPFCKLLFVLYTEEADLLERIIKTKYSKNMLLSNREIFTRISHKEVAKVVVDFANNLNLSFTVENEEELDRFNSDVILEEDSEEVDEFEEKEVTHV